MAKTITSKTPEPGAEITLDEFCLRLSNTDRRVELIGGFHASERRAGHIKASEARFASRYAEFANKPV